MKKLIIVTFGFLGFAFYEMSGGADFDAEETRQSRIEAPIVVEEEKLDTVLVDAAPELPESVTRVALNLNTVQEVVRPARTLPTERAPAPTIVEETEVTLSEEEPSVVLPSLLDDEIVVTPVDFSADAPVAAPQKDIRSVSGNSVNVRGGPGTTYSIVNRLGRGDQVEILQDPGDGWVKLRPVDGGTIGWMATFLLSEG